MGTGGPFSGVKGGQGVTLIIHPHLVPRSIMSRSYTSPPWRLHGSNVTGLLFTLERIIYSDAEHIAAQYVEIGEVLRRTDWPS